MVLQMMVETYLRRGQRGLQRILLKPEVRSMAAVAAYGGSGFLLSGASLAGFPQPLAAGLICAGTGWRALVMSTGAMLGYPSYWGMAGRQGIVWSAAAGMLALLLGQCLLSYEVFIRGIYQALTMRFDLLSLLTLTAVLVIGDGFFAIPAGRVPFCTGVSVALLLALWGVQLEKKAKWRTLKTVLSMENPVAAVKQEKAWHGLDCIFRQEGSLDDFTAMLETPDAATKVMRVYAPLMAQKQLTGGTSVADGLKIKGKEEAIRQMADLLLDNAVQYTNEHGRVSLHAAAEKKYIRLTLCNTVERLPAQRPAELAERFARGDTARSQKTGGAGIGLSAVKRITDLHRGRLEITYRDENTFCVCIELPPAKETKRQGPESGKEAGAAKVFSK